MRSGRFVLPVGMVLVALGLGACGNSPTSPTMLSLQAADDIAVQSAASLSGNSGGLMVELDAGAGSVPSNSAPWRLGPGEPVGNFRAVSAETTFTVGAVTFTVTRAFFDAEGTELPSYGPTATRLRITTRATGSIDTPHWDASIGRASILDVTGIEAARDTLQFDGAGNDTAQAHFTSFDGAHERWFYALGSRSLDAVRLLKDRNANPWPLSGTARWDWAADRLRSNNREDVEVHVMASVVITFNGTANPDIVINGSYRYHVNLATGEVTRA